jgi:hypothetical protein
MREGGVQRGANLLRELESPQVHVPQQQRLRPPRLLLLPDVLPLLRLPRPLRPARLRPPQRARRLRAALVPLVRLLREGGEEAGGGILRGGVQRLVLRVLAVLAVLDLGVLDLLADAGAAARGGSLRGSEGRRRGRVVSLSCGLTALPALPLSRRAIRLQAIKTAGDQAAVLIAERPRPVGGAGADADGGAKRPSPPLLSAHIRLLGSLPSSSRWIPRRRRLAAGRYCARVSGASPLSSPRLATLHPRGLAAGCLRLCWQMGVWAPVDALVYCSAGV